MGSSYGRQVLDQVGASIQVSADANPVCKVGGVTVDWSVVVAVSADTYLEDGFFCPNGEKYLRYGQVLTRENPLNTQTVTITGSPTGGTFTLTVVNPLTSVSMTTAPLAWNATGTDVMNALAALGNIGQGNVFGSGPATGPYGVTFQGIFVGSTVANMTASPSFTGGSSPGITVTAAAPTATPGN